MLGGPFPAAAAGPRKALRAVAVLPVRRGGHIDPVLLDVVSVLGEPVYALPRRHKSRLQQLVVLVVGRGKRRIDRAGHKEVQAGCSRDPLIVEMLLGRYAHRYLTESSTPGQHLGIAQPDRIGPVAGNDHHTAVHRSLEYVHHRYALVHQLHRFGQEHRNSLALPRPYQIFNSLRGKGMHYLHIQSLIVVESLLLRNIVAGKLSLGHPLGRKDKLGLACRGKRGGQCKNGYEATESHNILNYLTPPPCPPPENPPPPPNEVPPPKPPKPPRGPLKVEG